MNISNEQLFNEVYFAKDENDLQLVIEKYPNIFDDSNWKPLGGNNNNYGVVKNQQSNPIAALIEKVTNSIDAILTKRCYQENIDPKSADSPSSMDEAVGKFFPDNGSWDMSSFRKKQAEDIQIIADGHGPRNQKNQYPTSVIIYDNGEGQHPNKFEKTFLSLLHGNKNDIPFVQGKYNMGGSGAIVFCGKKRYQLIASKRYDGTGDFGFTLIREHPNKDERTKETWYEYFLVNEEIPSFPIKSLDLGLENRKFQTGTIIKMYSYQFPKGYSGFAQDLNQSVNELLFTPALPILTKDTALRYPNNNVLVNDLYGLKRRLFQEEKEYLETKFSEKFEDDVFGKMNVSCFVFKSRVKEYDIKRTKEIIKDRYFKNGMSVVFSMNGQVQGHYTSEFIVRSLQMNMLKSHLLIHVDCTEMSYDFRKEIFMASRDRLKDGEETQYLRQYLARRLSAKDGRLAEIQKRRKQAADVDTSSSTSQLLKNFTKNMPLDSELMKLLNQTFKLDIKKEDKLDKKSAPKKSHEEKVEEPFKPRRFPSKFKLEHKNDGVTEVSKIPVGGERSIKFSTDVEDDYFDRVDEPGEMKITVLNTKKNETDGGDKAGEPKETTDIFNVHRSSPKNGTIKINLSPKEDVKVGDSIQVKASLSAPGQDFDEIFWVKIVEPEEKKEKTPKPSKDEAPLGLPPLIFAYKDKEGKGDDVVAWEDVEEATSETMSYETVMIPEAEGDNLVKIFVNMESKVLMNFKSKNRNPNEDQIEFVNRKYYTSVYFHTLFLYTITKNRGYQISKKQEDGNEDVVDLGTYLKDVFDNFYSEFILSYKMEELMEGLGD